MLRRFRWLLFIVVFLVMPAFAVHILYVALKSPHPVAMSCADYLRAPGEQLWLDLKDCKIDYARAIRIYNKSSGMQPDDDNYAPVTTKFDDSAVLLFVKLDGKENALLNAVPEQPTREQIVALGRALHSGASREIKGTVQTGLDSDDKIRTAISGAGAPLVRDWLIIEQRDPTSWTVGVLLLLVPIGFGIWLFLRWRGQDHVASTAPPGQDIRT